MVLLIDNYDSFSYNLYQAIGLFDKDIKVVRNDETDIDGIMKLCPDFVVISPGPGKPSEAGICVEAIKRLYDKFPILGICLGHQAIFEAFGGTVSYAKKLMHGKSSEIAIDPDNALFLGLGKSMQAARYHSLSAVRSTLPEPLKIIAEAEDGEIMAVQHREFPVWGLQFHPESILTPKGEIIIKNFLKGH